MSQSRLNRGSLLSGIVFVILWVLASAHGGELGFMPDGQDIVTFYSNNSSRFWLLGYIGTLSSFFLLWFTGTMHNVLKRAGQAGEFWANIAFGGGVAASAISAASFSPIQVGLAERAGNMLLSPESAVAISAISTGLLGVALPIAFAAFSGATGVAIIQTKLLPTWFGWLTVILTLGFLSPIGYYFHLGILLWIFILSVWLFARHGRYSPTTARPPTP
jgi:hypothetical protein